jgi:hypothetical protein
VRGGIGFELAAKFGRHPEIQRARPVSSSLAGAAALRVGMSSTGAALPLIATRCEDSGAGFFTLLPFVHSCIRAFWF